MIESKPTSAGFRLLGALALLGLAAGCGSCKGTPASKASAAGFFPKSAPSFVTVEDPELLGSALQRLGGMKANDLARLALGVGEQADLFQPVVSQLGFDPRGPEGFVLAGIDRKKGIAVGEDEAGRRILVAGVSDQGAAGKWVAALAKRQGGLTKTERIWTGTETEPMPELKIPAFLGSDGAVRIAYVATKDWIVAADGKDAVEAVGRAVSRKEEDSLAKAHAYALTRQRIGEGRTVWGWVPPEKKKSRAAQRGLWGRGFSFGVTFGEKEVDARLRIPQGIIELSVLQAAANQVAGAELLPYLSQDDFLLSRVGGDPLALQPLLQGLFPSTFRQLRRAGIDPAKEILAHLQPGIVFGLSLEPDPNLSGGLPVQPTLNTTNPFHFVHTGLVARLKDPAKFEAVLEKIATSAEQLKMNVTSREEDGLRIYAATYAAGDGLTWALVGDKLIAAGGEGAFAKLLARTKKEAAPFQPRDPEAWKTFESGASAAHLDVPRLVSQLRAIPESSFGIGGFRLKAVLGSWISMLEELGGITVAFHVDGDGLVLDSKVEIE